VVDVSGDGFPDAAVVGFDVGAATDASFEHEETPRRRRTAASTHGINASPPTSWSFLTAHHPLRDTTCIGSAATLAPTE
jgi:hypothetical protein